jgi:hypothetical protein
MHVLLEVRYMCVYAMYAFTLENDHDMSRRHIISACPKHKILTACVLVCMT